MKLWYAEWVGRGHAIVPLIKLVKEFHRKMHMARALIQVIAPSLT